MSNYIEISGVAVPYEPYDDRWTTPDLYKTWRYYPTYLKHAASPLSPSNYFMHALGKILPTGELRESAARKYVAWDDTYLTRLAAWHAEWEAKVY